MKPTHAALIAVSLLTGGCASNSLPQAPSNAKLVPINKPAMQASEQAKTPDTASAKPSAFSQSEILVFRNLDPDRFEAMSRSSR